MDDVPRIGAILLTGPVGSGKTATAIAIGRALGEAAVPVVVIDLDWLGWTHLAGGSPAPDDMIATNLAAIWPNFVAAGMRYAVMSRALTNRSALSALKTAAPGADLTVARLSATAETIEARLRRRDGGAELAEHLNEAVEMARLMEGLGLEDLVVSTDRADAEAVATDIIRRLGWTAP